MGFILMFHSIIRWLIVLIAIAAVLKLGWGWLKKQDFTKLDQRLCSVLAALTGIQFLLGILLFFGPQISTGNRMEHAVTMFLAVFAASIPARWKNAPNAVRFRNSFIAIVIALLLIFMGVWRLNGWSR